MKALSHSHRVRSSRAERTNAWRLPTWLVACVVLALFIGAMSGCSGPARAAAVDAEQARETLEQVLGLWREGEKIDSCGQLGQEVVVQEMYWTQGVRLESYQVLKQEARDANLFVTVEMTLRDDQQGEWEEEVTYCVGTDPVLTVFRMMF